MLLQNFRPGKRFELVTYSWPNMGQATSVFVGPSASQLAWIPYYDHPSQLSEGALLDGWQGDESIPLLLKSGNQRPPDHFDGPVDFDRQLQHKDFRSALSIDQPMLYVNRYGAPTTLEFMSMARIGFTHVRFGPIERFEPGIGSRAGHVSSELNSIKITAFVRFKLSRIGQLIARAKTGRWPPNATLMIEYEIDPAHASVRVRFSGTSVPSQTSYMDWKIQSTYEIDTIDDMQRQQFMNAEGCQDAPTSLRTPASARLKIVELPVEETGITGGLSE